ncbi:hypothetical protein BH11ACT5_BH11ACT5_02680 [soil metagenome]
MGNLFPTLIRTTRRFDNPQRPRELNRLTKLAGPVEGAGLASTMKRQPRLATVTPLLKTFPCTAILKGETGIEES